MTDAEDVSPDLPDDVPGARFERRKRAIGLVAAPSAAVLVAILDRHGPAPALTALMTLAIGWWLTEALAAAAVALVVAALAVVLDLAPPKVAFAAFGSPLLFMFVGAFFVAEAMKVHGLGDRLAAAAGPAPTALNVVTTAGRGVRGQVEGHDVLVGSRRAMVEAGVDCSHLVVEAEAGEARGRETFEQALQTFTESQWRHMATEEKLLLPLASRHLLPQDWADVASAFESHADPRFDIEAEQSFDRVFTRLMNLAAAAAPQ